MSRVRAWKPDLLYYDELIAIECADRTGVYRLIDTFWTKKLHVCPREMAAETVIVPKVAIQFLPLRDIKHKKVELRHTRYLNEPVRRELERRCFAKDKTEEENYYTSGEGVQSTCWRGYVRLSTVRAIEKKLGTKTRLPKASE